MIGPHRFRKKPVVIEAALWDGGPEDATLIIDWVLEHGGTARYHNDLVDFGHDVMPGDKPVHDEFIAIDTLEGAMKARAGDFIIRGVRGEFYPCKPAIFASTYERVEP
jgi:hypothetical protein